MGEEEIHVKCEPNGLTFNGPFDKRQQASTTITNDGKKKIAIKIRTSDNGLFKVNLVYAFLEPGGNKQLTVRCGPFAYDSSKDYNHRIAVVYTAVDEAAINPQEVWKTAKDTKDVILKVEFKADAAAAPPAPPAEGAAPPAPPAGDAPPPAEGAAPPEGAPPPPPGDVGGEKPPEAAAPA